MSELLSIEVAYALPERQTVLSLRVAPGTSVLAAIEAMGLRPRLVRGDPTNLKVTFPLDLHLAEWILQHREDKA